MESKVKSQKGMNDYYRLQLGSERAIESHARFLPLEDDLRKGIWVVDELKRAPT